MKSSVNKNLCYAKEMKNTPPFFNKLFPGEIKLDIGCGHAKKAGFIGIDNFLGREQCGADMDNVDIQWDLSMGIPFEDSSVVEIFSSHFLEHVDLDFILKEIHRVLKNDGVLEFFVPYANSAEGMYPGHVSFLTEKFFQNNTLFNTLFKDIEYFFTPSEEWECGDIQKHFPVPFDVARKYLFNVCYQMQVKCRANKTLNR